MRFGKKILAGAAVTAAATLTPAAALAGGDGHHHDSDAKVDLGRVGVISHHEDTAYLKAAYKCDKHEKAIIKVLLLQKQDKHDDGHDYRRGDHDDDKKGTVVGFGHKKVHCTGHKEYVVIKVEAKKGEWDKGHAFAKAAIFTSNHEHDKDKEKVFLKTKHHHDDKH